MRLGFVTAVQLGLGCLEEIYSAGGTVQQLFTLADDAAPQKSGRVRLDDFAREHAIPLHKVRNINDPDTVATLDDAALDWLFIIGWSQIARSKVLTTPRLGCIGMHPTLLPEGRGRASIPWAILKGLTRTGVSMFKLDAGVDSGPLIAQIEIPVTADETANSLYDKVAEAHRRLMSQTLPSLLDDSVELRAQNHSAATVWPARSPADGEILTTMTVEEVDRLVRATTRPYPGAWMRTESGPLTVWRGTARYLADAGLHINLVNGVYSAVDVEGRSL